MCPAERAGPLRYYRTIIYIGTLKVEQDLGFATLTSLTGYQTSTAFVVVPGGLPVLGQPVAGQSGSYDDFYEHNKTFSQELQLTSRTNPDARFDWVAGAFHYDDHTELRLDTFFTSIADTCAPGIPTRNDGRPSTFSARSTAMERIASSRRPG